MSGAASIAATSGSPDRWSFQRICTDSARASDADATASAVAIRERLAQLSVVDSAGGLTARI